MIECQNVTCSYGEHVAIENINLTIQKGDFVAIVGPNGGGKTTLIKAIVGLLGCKEGKVIIDKTEQKYLPQGFVGYVPQILSSAVVEIPLSVKSVVAMSLLQTNRFYKGLTKSQKQVVDNVMRECGIDELQDRLISDLSGGERQKVFLARALASNPKLLILDEPSTGVDQKSQERFYQFLHELNAKGMTIVMTTHDIGVVSGWISKLISINRTVEYDGEPECFLTHDNLDKSYGHGMHCMGFGGCSHG